MGKQQPKFNFSLGSGLDGLDLSQDPTVLAAKKEQQIRSSQDALESTSILKPTVQFLQHDADVYKEYLKPGDHYGTPQDLDYKVADGQSTTRQFVNGIGRLLPLTASKLLGQVHGIGQAAEYAAGNKEVFLDDEFSNSIKSWEEKIKEMMPIYATKAYDGETLFEQMGTAKFWADDLGDGIAFLAAQMVGTKGISAGLKGIERGAGFLAKGAQGINLAEKIPGAAKIANAIANNYTAVTAGLINAGFTGALQAQDTAAQIKEGLNGKVNPKTGLEYTPEEINAIAGDRAANTFNATFLTHILPGIWESKIFLGLNKAKLGDLRSGVMGSVNSGKVKMTELLAGTGEAAVMKSVPKTIGKKMLEGALIEGVWEENIEQSIQKYDIQTGLNDKAVGTGERTLNYAMGLINNFTTKEDSKAIMLGMLLGAPMGAVSGYSQAKSYNAQMPGFIDALRRSDGLYQQDINSIYKTYASDVLNDDSSVKHAKGSIVIDEEGNPVQDPEKLKNLTFQVINQKQLWDQQTVATLTGNRDMATLNENVSLSAAVFRELATASADGDTAGALDFLKWRVKKQLQEQDEEQGQKAESDAAAEAVASNNTEAGPAGDIEAAQTATAAKSESAQFNNQQRAILSTAISANMQKLDTFAEAFKSADTQSKKLVKLGQSIDRANFNEVAKRGLFYESIKRHSFDEMIQDRQEELKDPLANIEEITADIEALNRLRNDSMDKSRAYLNNTDEIFSAYAGPSAKVGELYARLKTPLRAEMTPEENEKDTRERETAKYTLDELAETEGLRRTSIEGTDIRGVNMDDQNEEIISISPSERVAKPVGTRNQFFWKAGNDFEKMSALNQKITDYQEGRTTLKDVLTYAKESISHLDAETAKRLNSLIVTERGKLAELQSQLDSTPADLWSEPDLDGNEEYLGSNPEHGKLVDAITQVQNDINDGVEILVNKEAAAELDMINAEPQNVQRHLIRLFAMKHFEKGRNVLRNALDAAGLVRDDYFDRPMVNQAIKDLVRMRNSLEDRLNGGDLDGVKGLSYLVRDADKMLEQLYAIREQVEMNQSNREGKQAAINRAEASLLIDGMGQENNPELFALLDSIMGGTLAKAIADVNEMSEHQYEGVIAILHSIQQRATAGQLGQITKLVGKVSADAHRMAHNLIGGKSPIVTSAFASNPQQAFAGLWLNISVQNQKAGTHNVVENTKGSLRNRFLKDNDINDIISRAEALPDDTKDLGMPKADFLALADIFKKSLGARKVVNMLAVPIKPIVQSELRNAEGEELAPTTQQDIAIREGISWLNRPNTESKPYSGWAFLRGIAGTGKTNVVLKWILNNSGIDKGQVMTTALTQAATDVAGKSTGTQAVIFDQIENADIPANIKLIVIDEYGTIGESRLKVFEMRINALRAEGRDLKVLMLGDPTQITPRLQNNDDTNNLATNINAGNIEVINPLTVVYRSDISAVNEASDYFQDNDQKVQDISVRSDRPISQPLARGVHVSSAASQIPEIIARNIKEEQEQGLTPRTRAIIVGNTDDLAKYQGLGADVMTVFDAQSRTYDEVYVDINPNRFGNDFNTGMYTAASRAKLYTFLTYPSGENVVDTSLMAEYESNIDKLKASKTVFVQAKTAELAMMDSLDAGKTIRQAVKENKETVDNAGKSPVDVQTEQQQVDEDAEITEETESVPEDENEPVDNEPEGGVDPDTGLPPIDSPPLGVLLDGTRESVDNIDAEAYPALKKGVDPNDSRNNASPIKPGDKVIYLYHVQPSNGEVVVSVMGQSSDGRWVRLGKIFQKEIATDPRYTDIKSKIATMQPFPVEDTDVINGRRKANQEPFTAAELAAHTVREGRIGRSQYLKFVYGNTVASIGKDLAKHISSVFKNKFYYKSQADKSDKVKFKIFTKQEITSDTFDGTFTPDPGIPYAIVGADGSSYKNAMFVRLQANHLGQNDDQVVTLRELSESVKKMEQLTGIMMGTHTFHDVIRAFRHSLEIVHEPTAEGTVATVKPRLDYTKAEMIANLEEIFDKEKRKNQESDPLRIVPDNKLAEAMATIQHVAKQLYGIKQSEGKFTAEEIEAMGDEYEAIKPINTTYKNGKEVFYASLKTAVKRDYKKVWSLEVDNSKAQIAIDQIARSNEFVGGTRIRVQRYLGNKSKRSTSYKAKSLIAAEGGNTRLYSLMNMAAIHLVPDPHASKEDRFTFVRDMIDKNVEKITKMEGEDLAITYLKTKLNDLKDESISYNVGQALKKKEVSPIGLETLKLITDPANFDGSGQHNTAEQFTIKDRQGNPSVRSTFLRKPLVLDKFNTLGADPVANAEELSKLVNSSFSDISPTQIEVDFGSAATASVPTEPVLSAAEQEIEDRRKEEIRVGEFSVGSLRALNARYDAERAALNSLPVEITVTDHHADMDKRLEELSVAIKAEKDTKKRIALMKEKQALVKQRTGFAFDVNAGRPAPGGKITIQQAIADLNRMIPGITPGEIVFASKAILDKLANPGEHLLGLFDKSKIYLQAEDGTVFDKVLRHEVMHKIYHEFLSPKERTALRNEIDPNRQMTGVQFDEYLADQFMDYQRREAGGFKARIKAFFDKLLGWLGFATANRSAMETVFEKIEQGRYGAPRTGPSDVRRAFSNVKEDFGSVANYQQAVKTIHGMVRSTVMINNLSSWPVTMKEAKSYIKQSLLKSRNGLIADLADNQAVLDELLEDTTENAELIQDMQAIVAEDAAMLGTLNAVFPTTESGLLNEKVFERLWSDMYPNYKVGNGEAITSLDEWEEGTEPDENNEEMQGEEDTASGLQDFVKQSDEVNNEGKITENVKNFLSFIFKPNGQRINPRYAYLEALRNLNGLVTSEGNLSTQIKAAAAHNGIDLKGRSDGKIVINHILNLIDTAENEFFQDEQGKSVMLPRNARFFNENSFYYSENDVSEVDPSALNEADRTRYITRLPGENTPSFLRRIVADTALDKEVVIGYFKQAQAQESMREVMSNFLSQREGSFMIAEEAKVGKMGNAQTVLKYMNAQMYGAERVVATDIENTIKKNWRSISQEDWTKFEATKKPLDKVVIILKALKINTEDVNTASTMVADIAENLRAFRNVVDEAYKDGEPKPLKSDDSIEGELEFQQYVDVEYLLGDESSLITNLTRLLTRNSADSRPSKYQDVKGKTRYSFHNGNQALEAVQRVINVTGVNKRLDAFPGKNDEEKRDAGLPAHLRSKWAKWNPFVQGDLNQVHKILDHDGMRREGSEEFAVGYSDENPSENLQRQFGYAFLAYAKTNAQASEKNLKYIQYFFTLSNRPRIMGAEVNILRGDEIYHAAGRMLKQHLSQPEHRDVKNYNKYKTINMEEMGKAIISEVGPLNAETYTKLSKDAVLQHNVVTKFMENLKQVASQTADTIIAEKVMLGDDPGKLAQLMKDGRGYMTKEQADLMPGRISAKRDDPGYTKEQILPLVESFVMNNYINGYFLNQLPVGNYNYFKSAIDLVKRLSGAFAPGTKGMTGKFFMRPTYRSAVMEDPWMFADELSELFKEEQTALHKDMVDSNSGFELADGQGFMLPSRADNIVAGFGVAYNAGVIFKPAHYEVAPRLVGNETGDQLEYVPVMMKYSSVVLSDDLVAKYPRLLKLRQAMELAQTDELVFNSVNKIGAPNGSRPMPRMEDDGSGEYVIPEEAILTLSNENFRLQLNPKHTTYSEVSLFTQLAYFVNAGNNDNVAEAAAVNEPAAAEIYGALSNLIEHGLNKVKATLTSSGKVSKSAVQRTLTGAGNERIAEMLKEVSYNMPNIANKALIQIMNMFSKGTVKIKFKGGKFVLQSAYGFEMIKEDSDRFRALSPAQQAAHNANWSKYGEDERKKIATQARRLKYQRDAQGRLFAEVLIDKSFSDKARVGDFLLPDMMGYRIPSTELHSAIAIKVAGYYDSKGSNVIVAPPELVKQHGSDFDVDALYVISREVFFEDIPELGIFKGDTPGYEFDSRVGAMVFNKSNWEKKIARLYQIAGAEKALIRKVDKIYEMFQRNIIVENMMHVISHPVNIKRMTEPISTQVIEDTLVRLGLKTSRTMDLSNPLDNLDMFSSNFQGAKLVGIFANGTKALAYMKKAGPTGGFPTLQAKEGEVPVGVVIGTEQFNEFRETFTDGTRIWPVLDALINTAVDNVKEQQLYKINATDSTGKLYIAAAGLGIPLDTTVNLLLQPVGLRYSRLRGNPDAIKKELLIAYNTLVPDAQLDEWAKMAALISSQPAFGVEGMAEYRNKTLTELVEAKDPKAIMRQAQALISLEQLHNIAQDVSTFAKAISVVQDMPVMYEDIDAKEADWNKLGVAEGVTFTTNEKLSFNIDNIFKSQPNIRAAYSVFQAAKRAAETSLTKHLPAVRAFVDELVEESNIKLSYKQGAENMKDELMNYLISSFYSADNREETPVEYTYRGATKVATGKQAWSEKFIDRVVAEQTRMRGTKETSSFLSKVAVNNRYGLKTLTFAMSSNSDYIDSLEAQEAFEQMSEDMKWDFVKYAIMNYGLKFGVKNYSMFIPAQYLRPIDTYLKTIDRKLRSNRVDEEGKVMEGELRNIRDNFMLRLAVNNTEKLPFIGTRDFGGKVGISPVPTPGKMMLIQDISGPREVQSMEGMDEYYYNRKYENPIIDAETNKRTHKPERFPEFIRTGDNIAMMRLNSPDSDFVYYQKLGMKNWAGGYDASAEALAGDYTLDKYFGKGLIPLAVADTRVNEFTVRNEYIQVGSRVIVHGFNNESRDQGRHVIVTAVQEMIGDKSKRGITVRDADAADLTAQQVNFLTKYNPVIQMLSTKFNIPIQAISQQQMLELTGQENVKGNIRQGVAYINMDKATGDTAFHEVAHPLIDAIQAKNPVWFQKLMADARITPEWQSIYEHVDALYGMATEAEKEAETLVTILGRVAEQEYAKDTKWTSIFRRLMRELGSMIKKILKDAGVINIETLSNPEMATVTLDDLAAIIANKDAGITLDLSGFARYEIEQKQLDDIESQLFREGRIILTCKA